MDNTLLKKKGLPALSLNKFKTILVSFDIGESAEKNWLIQLYFQSDNSNQTQFEPNNMITGSLYWQGQATETFLECLLL